MWDGTSGNGPVTVTAGDEDTSAKNTPVSVGEVIVGAYRIDREHGQRGPSALLRERTSENGPVTVGDEDTAGKDMPIAVGEVIADKYRVERILGEGGMGVVVAAKHIRLNNIFAIKLMRPAIAANARAAGRFLEEARAAGVLKGEHIVRVFDVDRLPSGAPYMVMEYLEGTDLERLIRRGPLSLADAALCALQACLGLAEAHSRGIIHRDLKPANIFWTRLPDGAVQIKIIDFGISKIDRVDQPGTPDTAATRTGAGMGSPPYMSPEQFRDASRVDARSDIWAMGVSLYQIATGELPFGGELGMDVRTQIFESAPRRPSAIRPGLPADFGALILRCLEKDPAKRYPDVAALALALAPFAPQEARGLADRAARLLGPAGAAPVAVPPRETAKQAKAGVGRAAVLTVAIVVTATVVALAKVTASPMHAMQQGSASDTPASAQEEAASPASARSYLALATVRTQGVASSVPLSSSSFVGTAGVPTTRAKTKDKRGTPGAAAGRQDASQKPTLTASSIKAPPTAATSTSSPPGPVLSATVSESSPGALGDPFH